MAIISAWLIPFPELHISVFHYSGKSATDIGNSEWQKLQTQLSIRITHVHKADKSIYKDSNLRWAYYAYKSEFHLFSKKIKHYVSLKYKFFSFDQVNEGIIF